MGTKVLDQNEWSRWDAAYQQAASLLEGRDEALADLAAEVEADLELVGISAIEDKLQDGVPEAIQTLLDAGMRVLHSLRSF
jgi:phospholipid-transporting ATPase